MFDFDTTKLLLIGVVALAVIPPKDLPRVIRQVGQAIGKVRRMASEFQGQVMEALKEAELDDLKKEITSITDSAKAELNAVTDAAKVHMNFDPVTEAQQEMTKAIETDAPKVEALTAGGSGTAADMYARATGMPDGAVAAATVLPPVNEAALAALAMPDVAALPAVTHELIASQAGIALPVAAFAAPAADPPKATRTVEATRTVDLRHAEPLPVQTVDLQPVEVSPGGMPAALTGTHDANRALNGVSAGIAAEAIVLEDAVETDATADAGARIPYRKRVAYAAPLPGRAARAARRES